MAKYRCLAAAKLVELTASEKAETARRACLDIINQPKAEPEAEKNDATKPQVAQFSNRTGEQDIGGDGGGECEVTIYRKKVCAKGRHRPLFYI